MSGENRIPRLQGNWCLGRDMQSVDIKILAHGLSLVFNSAIVAIYYISRVVFFNWEATCMNLQRQFTPTAYMRCILHNPRKPIV